jgi:hypothetical protein
MGRHGLYEANDGENWDWIRWRGAVASAIRGKRGQSFLRDLLAAVDAIESRRLIGQKLEDDHGDVCALGALGRARGLDLSEIDYEDYEAVAKAFGINEKLAQEVMWVNDEWTRRNNVPDMMERYQTVRRWILEQIRSRGELVPMGKPESPK